MDDPSRAGDGPGKDARARHGWRATAAVGWFGVLMAGAVASIGDVWAYVGAGLAILAMVIELAAIRHAPTKRPTDWVTG